MKKLFVIFSLFLATNASAGILFEPYVGYLNGGTEQTGSPDADVSGVGYGVRLGWTLPLVFIALDYSTGSGLDYEVQSAKSETDYTAMGVVVGASLPLFRIWAGYNFDVEGDVENSATITGFKAEGTGMKGGLGFKLPVIPISFNLEYIINEFDESDGVSLTNKIDNKMLFVSISAPLTF